MRTRRPRILARRRVVRERYGIVRHIPPQESGALAACALCTWGRFFRDRKRGRYSSVARAAAALRGHARHHHTHIFLESLTFETGEF